MARREDTEETVRFRLVDLIDEFPRYLDLYDKMTPFSSPGQLQTHRETIRLRRKAGSLEEAVNDEMFARSLYATLEAWNMNQRAAVLYEFPIFWKAIKDVVPTLSEFQDVAIEDIDGTGMATRLCSWMDALHTSPVKNRVVTTTKTLHHLLPDLVPPMDRAYTRVFFQWYMPQFQANPRRFLLDVYPKLTMLAQRVQPQQYIGADWRTSRTKLLDNAVVAYCVKHRLSLS